MIVLYIMAYLAIGILVGWLCNRDFLPPEYMTVSGSDAFVVVVFWPVLVFVTLLSFLGHVLQWIIQ